MRGKKVGKIVKCHLHRKLASFHIKKLIEQSWRFNDSFSSSFLLNAFVESNRREISTDLKIAKIFHLFSFNKVKLFYAFFKCWVDSEQQDISILSIFHIIFIELLIFFVLCCSWTLSFLSVVLLIWAPNRTQ